MSTAGDDRSGDRRADQPADEDQWVFLIDPAWRPKATAETSPDEGPQPAEVEAPPIEAVVGGWLVAADGTVGRFDANPGYVPSRPGSPTDPVDATLQLLTRGEVDADALFAVMRECVFDVALDQEDRPIIAPSPDDVPSLLVSTAPVQRFRVHTDRWRTGVTAEELAELLLEYGVDVLFNPGGPASIRLIGDVFAKSVTAQEK
ncbi:type VII secretion system-associated protein [Lentzea sp. NPDC051208]|uniref:type VII secretion system-associated protein n=1 Tax=Lentzea sp. NPDC051208 TaxID=3154642 RepID=UPI0034294904